MTDPRLTSAKRKFTELLKEIFQFDCADLDFGIYRVLAMRRRELEDFLENDLIPQVEEALGGNEAEKAVLRGELAELEAALQKARIKDYSSNEAWRELKGKIDGADTVVLARTVFNDLTTFFSRYYDEGDFMALPRYKNGTYAIPYDGSEVTLHWANKDQYYIKTSELHTDYVARLSGVSGLEEPRLVFKLDHAEADKDNNKASEKRRYILRAADPVQVEGDTLTAWFEFRIPDGKTTAKQAPELAAAAILASPAVTPLWRNALTQTSARGEREALEFQLMRYMRKNTADYFIHKNLGPFLKRELDFFIKNEVIHLDDVEGRGVQELDLALRKVKAMRRVGGKIIDWLHQMEEFQKKLYLKKKFVLRTDWAITMDRIPSGLWPAISAVPAQQRWWTEMGMDVEGSKAAALFAADSGSGKRFFLSAAHDPDLTRMVVEAAYCQPSSHPVSRSVSKESGLLVQCDNYQGLRLVVKTVRSSLRAIYIDPPYNAKSSEIMYKNSFRHSAWLSMMAARLLATRRLMVAGTIPLVIAIDEVEQINLGQLLSDTFPEFERSCIVVVHNPAGQQSDNFSFTHEYAYFIYPKLGRFIAEQLREREEDWDERNLRDVTGDESLRESAANCFYPIIVRNGEIVEFGLVTPNDQHPPFNVKRSDGSIAVFPVDPQGVERKWRFARQTVESIRHELKAHFVNGRGGFDIKRTKKTFNFKSAWVDSKYSANNYGTQLLNQVIQRAPFSYPKSIHTVRDCVLASMNGSRDGAVLDYFGGSGTTGHAVIDLNREDNGRRSFVLMEMGDHFDSVLVPRILKATYSKDWKDGKPVDRQGLSALYKIIRLESYDDTLDNIELTDDPTVRDLRNENRLNLQGPAKEDYILRYQLDLESKGSLLRVERFTKPWSYTINTRKDGRLVDSPVDLVETFNYLIGLRVQKYESFDAEGILFVSGLDPEDQKVMVVWRDCDLWDEASLTLKCRQVFEGFKPNEYALVYVNGDHGLENVQREDDSFKIRPIESTFLHLMFDTEEGA